MIEIPDTTKEPTMTVTTAEELREHIVSRLVTAYKDKERNDPQRPKESDKWTDMMLIGASKNRVIAEWVRILQEQSGVDQIAFASSIGRYAILVPPELEEQLRPVAETCLPGLRHYYETIEAPQEWDFWNPNHDRMVVSWYTVDSHGYIRRVSAVTTNTEIKDQLTRIGLYNLVDDSFLDNLSGYQRGCLHGWAQTIDLYFKGGRPLDEVRGIDITPDFIADRLPESFKATMTNVAATRFPWGEKEIEATEYLVEANSDETHYLWRDWALQAKITNARIRDDYPRFTWEQLSGYCQQIGTLDDRPVMITIYWNRLNGHLIGFWTMDSQVTDHKMAREWLDKTFPNIPQTNVSNFTHALRIIKEEK